MRRFSLLLENQRNFLLKEDSSSNPYEGHIYDLNDGFPPPEYDFTDKAQVEADMPPIHEDSNDIKMLMRNSEQTTELDKARFAFHKKYLPLIIEHWNSDRAGLAEMVRRIYYGYVTMGDRFEMVENN